MRVTLDVEGIIGHLELKAVSGIDHDLVLGMDLCQHSSINVDYGKRSWRVSEGKWRSFERGDSAGPVGALSECAGISALNDEQELVVRELLERILHEPSEKLRCTHLVEHRIDVQVAEPYRQKLRRISSRKLEILQNEVTKLYELGALSLLKATGGVLL